MFSSFATITEKKLKCTLEIVVATISTIQLPYDHNDCSTFTVASAAIVVIPWNLPQVVSVVFVHLIFSLTNMHRAGAISAADNRSLLIKVCTNVQQCVKGQFIYLPGAKKSLSEAYNIHVYIRVETFYGMSILLRLSLSLENVKITG